MSALLRLIRLNAVAADDFVTAETVHGVNSDAFTVRTGRSREHRIGASVQLLHLRLHLAKVLIDEHVRRRRIDALPLLSRCH